MGNWLKDKFRNAFRRQAAEETAASGVPAQAVPGVTAEETVGTQPETVPVEMEIRELSDEERAALAEIPEEGPMFSAEQLQIMSAEEAPSGALSDLSASVAERFAEDDREEEIPEAAVSAENGETEEPAEIQETEPEEPIEMEVRELSEEERAALAEIPEEGPMFSAEQLQIMSAEEAPSGALSDLSASVADRFAEENQEEEIPETAVSAENEETEEPAETPETEPDTPVEMEVRELGGEETSALPEILGENETEPEEAETAVPETAETEENPAEEGQVLLFMGEGLPEVPLTDSDAQRIAAEIGAELDELGAPEEAPSALASELTDLWGLNKTPEELEKERRAQERRRRFGRFLKGVAAFLLIAAIGAGVYAYLEGWRINLFYEITGHVPAVTKPVESPGTVLDHQPGLTKAEEELPPEETEEPEEPGEEEPEEGEETGETKPEKEFVGITISQEEDPEKLVEEGPTEELEDPDQATVEETGPIQTIEVERAMNIYLAVDGSVQEIRVLESQAKTVGELLEFAGVKLKKHDYVEPVSATPLTDGATVRVTRVRYKKYTVTEVIPGRAIEKMTPVLAVGKTYEINPDQQADGEKEVTYRDKYVDGELVSHEEISSVVTKEPTDYILLVGAKIPASSINGASYTDIQILDNVPAEYTAVYSGRCTAYNFKSGVYGASGMYLFQGMVAVNPSVIPYGSLLYITSANGNFVYGWAIAADYCEASVNGDAVVDLFFETYREAALFGARNLNVYVIAQLYQGDLASYIANEGMFRSRIPAS